jgi:uncharacterized membrane protein
MASWFWLALLASIFWGLTYVLNQYMLRFLDPLAIFFLSTFFIAFMLAIYLSYTHQWQIIFHKFSDHPKLIWATLAYTFFYFLAGLLILKSIHAGNASLAAIIESAYPLFTIPFAYLLLHEIQFNWGILTGMSLILAGLIIVQHTNPN